ncbi:hypothetical protein [Marinobacter alexandrii]|nr:hypothetical protein [Marinobacter alexandrii]
MKPEAHKIDDANKARMTANQGRESRSTNGVSFAELMRELRGE